LSSTSHDAVLLTPTRVQGTRRGIGSGRLWWSASAESRRTSR
jgi:hypothetical protein